MLNENIIDLSNTSDLPFEVSSLIQKSVNSSALQYKILSIFQIGGDINIDQVIAGLYRGYQEIVPKKKIISSIHSLQKKKLIISTKRGTYTLMKHNHEIVEG